MLEIIKKLVTLGKEDNYLIKNDVRYKYENGRELLEVFEAMHFPIIMKLHCTGNFATSNTDEIVKIDPSSRDP